MSDHMTIPVEPLQLDNVCDGRVASQFAAALEKVAEAFEDEKLTQGREKVSAKVTIEVAFDYRPDTAALTLTGSVRTKLPEPKKAGSTAMLRNGRFLVEPDNQLELYTHDNTEEKR